MSPNSPFAAFARYTEDPVTQADRALDECSAHHSVARADLAEMMYIVIGANYGRNAYTAATLRALADLIESDCPAPGDPTTPPTADEQIATKIDQIIRELFA